MDAESFCHCGTHKEAVAAAEKLLIDMLASDCPVWAFQVGAALRTMALGVLQAEGMTTSDCKEFGDVLTHATRREQTATAELIASGRRRRGELGL